MNSIIFDTDVGKFNLMIAHNKYNMFRWLRFIDNQYKVKPDRIPCSIISMNFELIGIMNNKIIDHITKNVKYRSFKKVIFQIGKKQICVEGLRFSRNPILTTIDAFNNAMIYNNSPIDIKFIQCGNINSEFYYTSVKCNGPIKRMGDIND